MFRAGEYIAGLLNYIDYVSILQFNLFELASMMVRVGYPRHAICESYYCHPHFNDGCVGTQIGHPTDPLMDEDDVSRFMKVASTSKSRLVHVYVLEITPAHARARQQEDQIEFFKKILETKSSSRVVIEEIEEPHLGVPKPVRKKTKVISQTPPNAIPQTPLIGWYEPDPEFEKYLVHSLVKAREGWKAKESENESVHKNLMDEFVVVQVS